MTLRSAARVIVVLAATAAMAQSVLPGTTPGAPILNPQSMAARRGPTANRSADPLGLGAMREQVQDMESTVSQMRLALKEMQTRVAKNKTTDSLTKANLGMWELMVGHLDKELQQLRVTLAEREDLEVRRAALYKQADANAEVKAQAARAAQAARFAEAQKNANATPTPAATGQTVPPTPAPQTAPAQPPAPSTTNNSASPN